MGKERGNEKDCEVCRRMRRGNAAGGKPLRKVVVETVEEEDDVVDGKDGGKESQWGGGGGYIPFRIPIWMAGVVPAMTVFRLRYDRCRSLRRM